MQIATRRIGLKGSSNHKAFVAENRNISFPLLTTTNVCGWRRRRRRGTLELFMGFLSAVSPIYRSPLSTHTYQLVGVKSIDIFHWRGCQFRGKLSLHSNRYGNSLLECRIWLWAFILVFVIVSDLQNNTFAHTENTIRCCHNRTGRASVATRGCLKRKRIEQVYRYVNVYIYIGCLPTSMFFHNKNNFLLNRYLRIPYQENYGSSTNGGFELRFIV